jgi:hypothetical protein
VCVCVCVCVCVSVGESPHHQLDWIRYYKCEFSFGRKIDLVYCLIDLLGLGFEYVSNYYASLRWVHEHYFCDYINA